MTDSKNNYNQHQKPKGWGFTFFGETPETPELEEKTPKSGSFVNTGKSFPLAIASVGERLVIAKLKGTEGTVRRLIGMGLVPGTELQVISIANGSVIIALGDNRIGLGVGMAQKILCTNLGTSN
ncbi:FeoA family protein [Nostoc sp. 2RC]|uniref:FeoA family protein n=1 Tax=Nostoc sp. 2RC TaxID=2485484 RepID=UPI00162521C5|nr:FeoA family protein [Nostoc sp. 2RC]MBC1238387.1 ferrous iron transport protein A [Nostoc sp. 2RC]